MKIIKSNSQTIWFLFSINFKSSNLHRTGNQSLHPSPTVCSSQRILRKSAPQCHLSAGACPHSGRKRTDVSWPSSDTDRAAPGHGGQSEQQSVRQLSIQNASNVLHWIDEFRLLGHAGTRRRVVQSYGQTIDVGVSLESDFVYINVKKKLFFLFYKILKPQSNNCLDKIVQRNVNICGKCKQYSITYSWVAGPYRNHCLL